MLDLRKKCWCEEDDSLSQNLVVQGGVILLVTLLARKKPQGWDMGWDMGHGMWDMKS